MNYQQLRIALLKRFHHQRFELCARSFLNDSTSRLCCHRFLLLLAVSARSGCNEARLMSERCLPCHLYPTPPSFYPVCAPRQFSTTKGTLFRFWPISAILDFGRFFQSRFSSISWWPDPSGWQLRFRPEPLGLPMAPTLCSVCLN